MERELYAMQDMLNTLFHLVREEKAGMQNRQEMFREIRALEETVAEMLEELEREGLK